MPVILEVAKVRKGERVLNDQLKNEYELVFEGIDDPSPKTLQRIKGILIGDLELSIPEVQEALEKYPLTIKRSEDEKTLIVYSHTLKDAGAKVLILKPGETFKSAEEAPSNSELEFNLDGANLNGEETKAENTSMQPSEESPEEHHEEIEFEIEFEASHPEVKKQNTPKTYELNLDDHEDLSLESLKKDWSDMGHEESTPTLDLTPKDNITPINTASKTDEFTLDLKEPEGIKELIDTSEKPLADIDENGEWGLNTLSSSLVGEAAASKPFTPSELNTSLQLAESNTDVSNSTNDTITSESNAINQALSGLNEAASPAAGSNVVQPKMSAFEPIELKLEGEDEHIEEKAAETITTPTPQSNISLDAAIEHRPVKKEVNVEVSPEDPIANEKSPAVDTAAPPVFTKKKKSKMQLDIALPVVIGGIMLGVVNWFYFSNQEVAAPLKVDMTQLADPKPKKAPKVKAVPEAPYFDYSGALEDENLKISGKLNTNLTKVASISLLIETPPPPALSAEEIVQKRPPRVWLRKAEVDVVNFKHGEDKTLIGTGSAKLYMEQGETRNRLIANVTMTIIPDVSGTELNSHMEIQLNHDMRPENNSREIVLDKDETGQYRVYIGRPIQFRKEAVVAAPKAQKDDAHAEITKEVKAESANRDSEVKAASIEGNEAISAVSGNSTDKEISSENTSHE